MYEDYKVVHESHVFNEFYFGVGLFIALVIIFIFLYSMSKIFKKASIKEIYAYIPFYNIFKLFEICAIEKYYVIILFIPIMNLYVLYLIAISLSECFNKDNNFAFLLYFLPIVAFPILAFSNDKFVGINNKKVNGIFIEELMKEEVESVEKSEILRRDVQVGMGESTAPKLNVDNTAEEIDGELKINTDVLNNNRKQVDYIECPNCHNRIKESADVCFYCGQKLK